MEHTPWLGFHLLVCPAVGTLVSGDFGMHGLGLCSELQGRWPGQRVGFQCHLQSFRVEPTEVQEHLMGLLLRTLVLLDKPCCVLGILFGHILELVIQFCLPEGNALIGQLMVGHLQEADLGLLGCHSPKALGQAGHADQDRKEHTAVGRQKRSGPHWTASDCDSRMAYGLESEPFRMQT